MSGENLQMTEIRSCIYNSLLRHFSRKGRTTNPCCYLHSHYVTRKRRGRSTSTSQTYSCWEVLTHSPTVGKGKEETTEPTRHSLIVWGFFCRSEYNWPSSRLQPAQRQGSSRTVWVFHMHTTAEGQYLPGCNRIESTHSRQKL